MKTRGGGKGGGCLGGKHRQRKRLDPKPVKGRTGTQGPRYLFRNIQNMNIKIPSRRNLGKRVYMGTFFTMVKFIS